MLLYKEILLKDCSIIINIVLLYKFKFEIYKLQKNVWIE